MCFVQAFFIGHKIMWEGYLDFLPYFRERTRELWVGAEKKKSGFSCVMAFRPDFPLSSADLFCPFQAGVTQV